MGPGAVPDDLPLDGWGMLKVFPGVWEHNHQRQGQNVQKQEEAVGFYIGGQSLKCLGGRRWERESE